jgi:carbon storage regulator CsrA
LVQEEVVFRQFSTDLEANHQSNQKGLAMLMINRKTAKVAQDTRKDIITLANGLITIRVMSVQGEEVRLAIHAPEDIDITRGEASAELVANG